MDLDWRDLDGFWMDYDRVIYENLVKRIPSRSMMVEVGSFRGKSICSIADIIKEKQLQVFSVDIFDKIDSPGYVELGVEQKRKGMAEDCRKNLEAFGLLDSVKMVIASSLSCAKFMEEAAIKPHLVFIDADHSYEAVKMDIAAWFPLLEYGGILCGHDYGAQWPGVVKAVDERFPERMVQEYIWSVVK